VETLCSRVNADLRSLTCWLNVNKISLNAKKIEFVLFRPKSKFLHYLPHLKLTGKRIYPSSSIKYLGVYLDEHLNWKPQINEIANKLKRANGALSKLRHYIPLKPLINIYHAIFASHMRYACQVWGLRDTSVTHRILTLQKLALRLITFSKPRSPSSPIFSELGILNFFDLVEVMNILSVHQHLNSKLPTDLLLSFSFSKMSHSFGTRDISLGLLNLPIANTKTYGLNSFTCLAIQQWNSLQRSFSDITLAETSYYELKSIIQKAYLCTYADSG
jgi:hypothetical protein